MKANEGVEWEKEAKEGREGVLNERKDREKEGEITSERGGE